MLWGKKGSQKGFDKLVFFVKIGSSGWLNGVFDYLNNKLSSHLFKNGKFMNVLCEIVTEGHICSCACGECWSEFKIVSFKPEPIFSIFGIVENELPMEKL